MNLRSTLGQPWVCTGPSQRPLGTPHRPQGGAQGPPRDPQRFPRIPQASPRHVFMISDGFKVFSMEKTRLA